MRATAPALRIHLEAVRPHRRRRGRPTARPAKSIPVCDAPRSFSSAGTVNCRWPPHGRRRTVWTRRPGMRRGWRLHATNLPVSIHVLLPGSQWHFIPLRTQRAIGRRRRDREEHQQCIRSMQKRARCSGRSPNRPRRRSSASFLARRDDGGAKRGRDRARPQHPAGIGLARFPHPARVDPGIGNKPARLPRQTRCRGPDRVCSREIKAEAEGLDEMVRNLLAMTRIDAGALELRRDWVDLREIVERVVSATKRRGAALAARAGLAGRHFR